MGDWATFRQNMSKNAEMGDEAVHDNDNKNLKEYGVSRSVRKTKRLLDCVVRGLPVLEDARVREDNHDEAEETFNNMRATKASTSIPSAARGNSVLEGKQPPAALTSTIELEKVPSSLSTTTHHHPPTPKMDSASPASLATSSSLSLSMSISVTSSFMSVSSSSLMPTPSTLEIIAS